MVLDQKNIFCVFFVLNQKWASFCFVSVWDRNYKKGIKLDLLTRPSPFSEQWEDLGTKLFLPQISLPRDIPLPAVHI